MAKTTCTHITIWLYSAEDQFSAWMHAEQTGNFPNGFCCDWDREEILANAIGWASRDGHVRAQDAV